MDMIPVMSSNIAFIGYDAKTYTLRIVFRYGVYEYHGVNRKIFDQFLVAPSKGKFFNTFIKNRYPRVKIN